MWEKTLVLIGLLGLLVGLPACKKRAAEQGANASLEVEDVAEPELPVADKDKIEPEAEAEDPPQPAVEEGPQLEGFIFQGAQMQRGEGDHRVGVVGDVQLVRLFADRFSSLKREERVMTYHLARAILAGRDILFDQMHRDGLEVRQLVERVLRNLDRFDAEVVAKLSEYHQLLGIHASFYDRHSGKKLPPSVGFEKFSAAVQAAYADGTEIGLARDESLEGMLSRLRRTMFDPAYQPTLNSGQKARGRAYGSVLNLYRGVTRRALRRFAERYPHNSRLVNIEGRLVEDVYRSGDRRRKIPPGRYARELRRVVRRLQNATASASKQHRQLLGDLTEHLLTGDPTAFDQALNTWQDRVLNVEFLLGFIDFSLDPRGVKGLYSGWVGYRDGPNTSKLESLLRHLQHFEDEMPWETKCRKHWRRKPSTMAVDLLVGVGQAAPACPFGFRLPPDRSMGEHFARKTLLFTNVIEAHRQAVALPLVRELLPADQREGALEHLGEFFLIRAALREVLGRDLGVQHAGVKARLREQLPLVESLKAELLALWLLADPKLVELGLLSGKAASQAAWDYAVAEALVLDSMVEAEPIQPEALARRVLVRFLVDEAEAVGFQQDQRRVCPRILDREKLRLAVGQLLNRCGLILCTGDRQAALALWKQYALPGAWPQSESLAKRARAIGLRPQVACVMPKLKPRRGSESGRIEDATVSHDEQFPDQLLRIARY